MIRIILLKIDLDQIESNIPELACFQPCPVYLPNDQEVKVSTNEEEEEEADEGNDISVLSPVPPPILPNPPPLTPTELQHTIISISTPTLACSRPCIDNNILQNPITSPILRNEDLSKLLSYKPLACAQPNPVRFNKKLKKPITTLACAQPNPVRFNNNIPIHPPSSLDCSNPSPPIVPIIETPITITTQPPSPPPPPPPTSVPIPPSMPTPPPLACARPPPIQPPPPPFLLTPPPSMPTPPPLACGPRPPPISPPFPPPTTTPQPTPPPPPPTLTELQHKMQFQPRPSSPPLGPPPLACGPRQIKLPDSFFSSVPRADPNSPLEPSILTPPPLACGPRQYIIPDDYLLADPILEIEDEMEGPWFGQSCMNHPAKSPSVQAPFSLSLDQFEEIAKHLWHLNEHLSSSPSFLSPSSALSACLFYNY